MTDRDARDAAQARLPSTGLAVACALHALPLGWGAFMLPMRVGSWLGLVLGLLAALHATVAVLALLRRERALVVAWRALSVCSLVTLLGATWVVGSAALYLSTLYRGIGIAVSAAMFAIWGLLVLFTVPISAWGLGRTRPRWLAGQGARGGLAALALLVAVNALLVVRAARAEPVAGADEDALARALTEARPAPKSASLAQASLFHLAPALCAEPVDGARLTLLVTSLDVTRRPAGTCLQARDARGLAQALTRLVPDAHAVATLDLVQGVHAIPRLPALLTGLSIRPALDGVCGAKRCLAPWQLVAMDAFTQNQPLEAVPDARFGVSPEALARALGSAPGETLTRIETASFVLRGGTLVPFVRLRPRTLDGGDDALARAATAAGRHILAAQGQDGSFRYLLEPFSGRAEASAMNLPRQAGTTLALCELMHGPEATKVVQRALDRLASHARVRGPLTALSESDKASLGHSALPLIAFASCRARTGDRYDALMGNLARLLLAMQRPDGSFFPSLDLVSGTPSGDHEPLYAAGQAVMALVHVEQLARTVPGPLWPARDVLARALDRAMDHYARAYWPRPLRSLFYLEENWHCLAARAALASHRHDDYERFCIDYVDFKARLILEDDDVAPEHLGGYGLSSMFPPHSTATAGYGEALAAAMHVMHARRESLDEAAARMRRVLGFVRRQQWSELACVACAEGAEAVGGFSESSGSPTIRIDYVQHAMAALGHGSAALALGSGSR